MTVRTFKCGIPSEPNVWMVKLELETNLITPLAKR
jgi:hypothetical protein